MEISTVWAVVHKLHTWHWVVNRLNVQTCSCSSATGGMKSLWSGKVSQQCHVQEQVMVAAIATPAQGKQCISDGPGWVDVNKWS